MKKTLNFLNLICLILCLLPSTYAYCGDCFYWPKTLKEVLKQNKDKNKIYFRSTIIEPIKLKKPHPYYDAFNIKIHEYWAKTPFETESDTLCILGNVCGMTLIPGSEYLLVLEYNDGYYCDLEWSGTDSFSKYKKDISLLGPSRTIRLKTTPEQTIHASNPLADKWSMSAVWFTGGFIIIIAAFVWRTKRRKH
jgi:hypothetical protein